MPSTRAHPHPEELRAFALGLLPDATDEEMMRYPFNALAASIVMLPSFIAPIVSRTLLLRSRSSGRGSAYAGQLSGLQLPRIGIGKVTAVLLAGLGFAFMAVTLPPRTEP